MAKEKRDKSDSKDKKRKREFEDGIKNKRKAEKLAKKVAQHMQKHSAPTDDADAPLGGGRFVWTKKIEKDLASGAHVRDFSKKAEQHRAVERQVEIEKVQKRREERELEKARAEEEALMLNRERAVAEGFELDKKEELFHLEQAKMRSTQRLREGRGKASDVVAKDLHLADLFDMEAAQPYAVFAGLTLMEIRELHEDIELWQDLDVHSEEHVQFWGAMRTVADHELGEARRQEDIDRARVRGEAPAPHLLTREAGWHASIDADVSIMLAGKSHGELLELEDSIEIQLDGGEAADPEYWAAVLKRLHIAKAKARLREIHASLLEEHLRQLQAQEMDVDVAKAMGWDKEAAQIGGDTAGGTVPAANATAVEESLEGTAEDLVQATGGAEPDMEAEAQLAAVVAPDSGSDSEEEENTGQWSPRAVAAAVVAGQDVVAEDDDQRLLGLLRAQVKYKEATKYRSAGGLPSASEGDRAYRQMVSDASGTGGVHPMMRNLTDAAPQEGEQAFRSGKGAAGSAAGAEDAALHSVAGRMMGDLATSGDAPFGGEVQVDSRVYWWHDKYRPRKPKYFNRVHTGYEWNKYNQTHYDHDNPPPKVVQGYKFNVFYPDLLEKNEAPTYSCEPDPSSDGTTCLLRFHAGPPYEDIAFRIVGKEWEYSHKRGFKGTFERGIMHVYFNFKRARYRR